MTSTGANTQPGFGVAYSRRIVFAVGQVTATLPPGVEVTMGVLVVVDGAGGGAVVVGTAAVGRATAIVGGIVVDGPGPAMGAKDEGFGMVPVVVARVVTTVVVVSDEATTSGRNAVVDETASGATA